MPITDLEIIVGTYEEFLLGYKVTKKDNELGLPHKKLSLVQSFAFPSHRASIRSVAAKGKYLASGSADETITLYDMNSRRESGILVQHTGTVNCLNFSPNGSHLLSASEDGSIAVFRTGSWQLEKIFPKAHKGGAVTHLSVHPSGKLALSVGADSTLRTWNLVKGRQAYATNLGNVQLKKKIICACFTKESELAIGDEGGEISFYDISEKKQLNVIKAHDSRVKCLSSVNIEDKIFLISVSSNGEIKLWKCKIAKVKRVCSINCDCRITCLEVVTKTTAKNSTEIQLKQEENDDIIELNNSKRQRSDSEGDPVKKKRKTERKDKKVISQNSPVTEVICTKGQKWIVENV
ncbi:p21-activated protein kinase-interacting 1-like protein [Blattella germanica]|nr:p21-activated protein kinase-interacting 1-like protein [Blattella germanica]